MNFKITRLLFVIAVAFVVIGNMTFVFAQNEPIPACTKKQSKYAAGLIADVNFSDILPTAFQTLSTGTTSLYKVQTAFVLINALEHQWDEKKEYLPNCALASEAKLTITRLFDGLNRLSSLMMVQVGVPNVDLIGQMSFVLEDIIKDYKTVLAFDAEFNAVKDDSQLVLQGTDNRVRNDLQFSVGSYDIKAVSDSGMVITLSVNRGKCDFGKDGTILDLTDLTSEQSGILKVSRDCNAMFSITSAKGDWTITVTPQ